MMLISPDLSHERILNEHKPLLAFDEGRDLEAQREAIHEKLAMLLGDMPQKVDLNMTVEYEKEYNTYTDIRFLFDTEKDVKAVCHLWIPRLDRKKYPLVICLQGHSTGMHISMGRPIFPGDEEKIHGGDRDFAVQAIAQGYAALIVEQRGMGERRNNKSDEVGPRCQYTAMTALLIGRTLLGERVWDVSRALDAVSQFEKVDMDKIACLGNSGGGTTTYYAACIEKRIKIAVPSCSVCTYKDSIGAMKHCVCNYIPNAAKYFDMGDLAALIVPRKLIVVAGEQDPIFPRKGVLEAYDTIQSIYKTAGVKDNCRLVMGGASHRFYANPTWEVFRRMTNW